MFVKILSKIMVVSSLTGPSGDVLHTENAIFVVCFAGSPVKI